MSRTPFMNVVVTALLLTAAATPAAAQPRFQGLGQLPGYDAFDAQGVSADGSTITGYGLNPAGQSESWVARIDVPEPSTLALLLLGCACLTRRTFSARRARS